VLKGKRVRVPPNNSLVIVVQFSLGMVVCLTVLEVVHLIVLGKWNSEVFASITGLIGTVSGIIIGQRI
jgi:hypothetical protein